MRLVFDIETDGFLEDCTKIHCIVAYDLDTEELHSFGPTKIDTGLHLLCDADVLIGHNVMGFDLPALAKLDATESWLPHWSDFKSAPKVLDTMLLTRLIWPEIGKVDKQKRLKLYPDMPGKRVGSHSLDAWGYRLGVKKMVYDGDFQTWTPHMQEYCEQDVMTNAALYRKIEEKAPAPEAIRLEHRFNIYTKRLERGGWPLDIDYCQKLYREIGDRREDVYQRLQALHPYHEKITMKRPAHYVARGERFSTKGEARKAHGAKVEITDGPFKVKTVEFNPASRHHRARFLKTYPDWTPVGFTLDAVPKVDETSLERARGQVPDDVLDDLIDLLMLDKRLGQIGDGDNAWLKLEKNGRIHPGIISTGCRTGRCSHVAPNIAQVPAKYSRTGDIQPYGEECRKIWKTDPGFLLVGADASGLELRMLSHFMHPWDNGEYTQLVLHGDVHTANMEAAGLSERPQAKTFIYAYLYGAGNAKLGSIVAPGASEATQQRHGAELKRKFATKFPALESLQDTIKTRAGFYKVTKGKQSFWRMSKTGRGYILGIDKRRLPVPSAHSALNTLLQGAGGILMKEAASIFTERLDSMGWTAAEWQPVGHIHDEMQTMVRKDLANEAGRICVESIQAAGKHFRMRLPIDGEYKVGATWAETH